MIFITADLLQISFDCTLIRFDANLLHFQKFEVCWFLAKFHDFIPKTRQNHAVYPVFASISVENLQFYLVIKLRQAIMAAKSLGEKNGKKAKHRQSCSEVQRIRLYHRTTVRPTMDIGSIR